MFDTSCRIEIFITLLTIVCSPEDNILTLTLFFYLFLNKELLFIPFLKDISHNKTARKKVKNVLEDYEK